MKVPSVEYCKLKFCMYEAQENLLDKFEKKKKQGHRVPFVKKRTRSVHQYCTVVDKISELQPQSNQSAGPVRFLIFCSISIILLASLVAGRKPQWTAGAD